MKRHIYGQLFRLNEGFQEVLDSLRELRKQPSLEDQEIRRLEALTAEARAITNSYLLEAFGTLETIEAGKLFRKHLARERKEEKK
jgi:hypothetical protein